MKLKTANDLWQEFATRSLAGIPTTSQSYMAAKLTFYAAMNNLLAYQHNVLGSEEVPEEQGAMVLERLLQEIQAYMNTQPAVRRREDFPEVKT